jgi:poly(beta-D-mannuronate) lyase
MYNSYHDRAVASSGSPAEAIRIGSSETAWLNFGAGVGYNRFERVDGETELITLKGSYMNVHHNTAINCNSSFTFRHGNFGIFDANVLINAGLRIYGHGHTITRNQVIAVSHNQLRQAITIGQGTVADDNGSSGVVGASNANHAQVRDCIINNNIIASDNATNLNIMTLGFDTSGGTFSPTNNTINYNIITASTGVLTKQDNGSLWSGNTVSGNILWPTGTATVGDMLSGSYFLADPQLLRLSDTTCRCAYVLASGQVGVNA